MNEAPDSGQIRDRLRPVFGEVRALKEDGRAWVQVRGRLCLAPEDDLPLIGEGDTEEERYRDLFDRVSRAAVSVKGARHPGVNRVYNGDDREVLIAEDGSFVSGDRVHTSHRLRPRRGVRAVEGVESVVVEPAHV